MCHVQYSEGRAKSRGVPNRTVKPAKLGSVTTVSVDLCLFVSFDKKQSVCPE